MDILKEELIKVGKKYKMDSQYRQRFYQPMIKEFDLERFFKSKSINHQYCQSDKTKEGNLPNQRKVNNQSEESEAIVMKPYKQILEEMNRKWEQPQSEPLKKEEENTNHPKQEQTFKSYVVKPNETKSAPIPIQIEQNKKSLRSNNQASQQSKKAKKQQQQHQNSLKYLKKTSETTKTISLNQRQTSKKQQSQSSKANLQKNQDYHDEDSIWKKYVILKSPVSWENSNTTTLSNDISQQKELSTEFKSAPVNKSSEDSSSKPKNQKQESEAEAVQNMQILKLKDFEKQRDLMSIQEMRQIYDNYTPVHVPEEELERIIKSMNEVKDDIWGVNYLNKVYLRYLKNGGETPKLQFQQKLIADLLFMVKEDNRKRWNTTELD